MIGGKSLDKIKRNFPSFVPFGKLEKFPELVRDLIKIVLDAYKFGKLGKFPELVRDLIKILLVIFAPKHCL
jgi:hypothetical protein